MVGKAHFGICKEVVSVHVFTQFHRGLDIVHYCPHWSPMFEIYFTYSLDTMKAEKFTRYRIHVRDNFFQM